MKQKKNFVAFKHEVVGPVGFVPTDIVGTIHMTRGSLTRSQFNFSCPHHEYHTYEKSVDYVCVSAMVFCVALKHC